MIQISMKYKVHIKNFLSDASFFQEAIAQVVTLVQKDW